MSNETVQKYVKDTHIPKACYTHLSHNSLIARLEQPTRRDNSALASWSRELLRDTARACAYPALRYRAAVRLSSVM
jgi:hypothetical protein